jgi:hypothetical protein
LESKKLLRPGLQGQELKRELNAAAREILGIKVPTPLDLGKRAWRQMSERARAKASQHPQSRLIVLRQIVPSAAGRTVHPRLGFLGSGARCDGAIANAPGVVSASFKGCAAGISPKRKTRKDLPMAAVRYVEVTVTGSTGVAVHCEKCEHEFYYKLVCKAFGRANLGPLTSREDAQRTAAGRAKQKLRELVKTQIAPVPCPQCGCYQQNMVPLLRARQSPRLNKYGLAGLLLGPLVVAVGFAITGATSGGPVGQGGGARFALGLGVMGVGAVLAVAGLLLLVIRWYRSQTSYDPNDPKTVQERIALGRKLAITKELYQQLKKAAEA